MEIVNDLPVKVVSSTATAIISLSIIITIYLMGVHGHWWVRNELMDIVIYKYVGPLLDFIAGPITP
jgi:hypothetical protein